MANINLPYGIDNFEKVRTSGCYYLDKTGFIEELLAETFDVNLITRPRRFGKTLTISMLAEFLDIRRESQKLFEGLEIMENKKLCTEWMNQWPVLSLTLKDVEGDEFQGAYHLLEKMASRLCINHAYLGESGRVDEADQKTFLRLKFSEADVAEIQCALDTLLRMMEMHFGRKVILLIDEYDVPLAKASDHGYYNEMLNIIKKFLGMTWKSNTSLKFAVVTGCLRIAKESIFTGANNFISNSITDTSHNNIIRRFIELPHMNVTKKFETLLSGGVINEQIREDLTYDIADSSEDNLWSILYLTGYLTQVLPEELPKGVKPETGKTVLRIPNEEVRAEFGETVRVWFEERTAARDRRDFFEEWWTGNAGKLTQEVSDILFDTISYFNYKEDFYQGFLAGLFSGAGYDVNSDIEQGKGRADIVVRDQKHRRALVIEAKWTKGRSALEGECEKALSQIGERQYGKNLWMEGYRTVLCYGAAFQGKECLIRFAG